MNAHALTRGMHVSFWVYYNDLGGNGPESGIEQFASVDEAARFIDQGNQAGEVI
jgi:hypothetical protein